MTESPVHSLLKDLRRRPETIVAAVNVGLRTVPDAENARRHYTSYGETIDHSAVQRVLPPWMDMMGIYDVTNRLSSVQMHTELLANASDTMLTGISYEVNGNPAEQLSKQNARFMSTAFTLGLVAAAVGSEISGCIKPEAKINPAFAVAIGTTFATPASNVMEYMDRIDQLLPDPTKQKQEDPHQQPQSLMDYLVKYQAFHGKNTGAHCPATFISGQLLDAWGHTLHTDQSYRQDVITSIRKVRAA